MGGGHIGVAVGSLGALRRSSTVTIVLVFGLLTILLLGLLVVLDLFLLDLPFPTWFTILFATAFLFILLQWAIAPAIVRWAIRGRQPVTPRSNPWLFSTVEGLARQAGVPVPRTWTSRDPSPNAFVFGRTLRSAELVVTRGLLERLTQDEIRGVLAHEIGHLRHRDVITMTWVSAVPILAYVLARGGFEVLRGSGGSRSDKGSGAAILVAIAVAVLAYVVYLVTQLLVLYLSRTREYYADAYSAAATREPHHLASALTKITFGLSLARKNSEPPGLRAFYISDPWKAADEQKALQDRIHAYDLDRDGQLDAYELQKALEVDRRNPWKRANELFRTHPPTFKRILMLEQIEEEIHRGSLPANVYQFV